VTTHRYELHFRPAAVRQLRKLPKDVLGRLKAATEALRNQPRPPGAVKLAGTDNLWRIRIGDFGWSTPSLTRSW
jgi:mRNA interferase RelE/StbE